MCHLLDRLAEIPIVHFGDVDPNGIRILLHLQRRAPGLRWFLPEFWFELAHDVALRAPWPPDLDLEFAPVAVRNLAARGLWLEQERIVLDPRIAGALESMLDVGVSGR